MEKTYSQAELDEKVVQEVRKAIEHRATWMYLLGSQGERAGLGRVCPSGDLDHRLPGRPEKAG